MEKVITYWIVRPVSGSERYQIGRLVAQVRPKTIQVRACDATDWRSRVYRKHEGRLYFLSERMAVDALVKRIKENICKHQAEAKHQKTRLEQVEGLRDIIYAATDEEG